MLVEVQEAVDALVMDGATNEEIEKESRRLAALGRMVLIFPNQQLMNLWLAQGAKPSISPL